MRWVMDRFGYYPPFQQLDAIALAENPRFREATIFLHREPPDWERRKRNIVKGSGDGGHHHSNRRLLMLRSF
jgi:hypothetical protein